MKKKIAVICISLTALTIALAGNSWAGRERGGGHRTDRGDRFQDVDNSSRGHLNHGHVRDHRPGHYPLRKFKGPGPRFKYKGFKGHHRPARWLKHKYYRRKLYRAPHRFRPKYRHWRHWRHRPVYRHGGWHPRYHKWRHRHSMVQEINNYYSSAEAEAAPEEEFHASASVSESGYSVSVGASKTN